MRKERKELKIADIELNKGQLEWLPQNPRQWTKADIERTAKSIEEDPDFLEDRPLLVVAFGKKYVVFGGNLRREGCKKLGKATAPAVEYFPETEEDYQTVIRRSLKDNGSFGSFDYDILANEYDDLPLEDYGLKVWDDKTEAQKQMENGVSPEDYGTEFNLPDGEKVPFQQMAFTLADEQVADVKEALRKAKESDEFKFWDFHGNENGNGNALALIIEQWLQQRK